MEQEIEFVQDVYEIGKVSAWKSFKMSSLYHSKIKYIIIFSSWGKWEIWKLI